MCSNRAAGSCYNSVMFTTISEVLIFLEIVYSIYFFRTDDSL